METSTDLRTSTGATAHILLHDDFIEINSKDEFPTITDVFAVKAEFNGVESKLTIMTFMKNDRDMREIRNFTFHGSEVVVKEWECRLLWHVDKAYVKALLTDDEQKTTKPPKRKVLIIINPFSGGGAARAALTQAMTMLEHANLEITIAQTERQGHAA